MLSNLYSWKAVTKVNIIICEDKAEIINELTRIIDSFLESAGIRYSVNAFRKYDAALSYIKSLKSYDECLYILDIDLKQDKNGLQLGREIRTIDDYKGEMVFVTAHIHQVNTVFKYKLRILDFIDKGFNLENELREALGVFLRMYKEKFQNEQLVFKSGTDVYMVKPSDIVWIETDKQKKKIIVHTVKEDVSIHMTLKEIQEMLGSQFIQIHRCTIVNKDHIVKLEHSGDDMYAMLTGDVKEIVSKRKEKEVAACCTHS
jgi:two-component system, LytTR family, response regulator AgrA